MSGRGVEILVLASAAVTYVQGELIVGDMTLLPAFRPLAFNVSCTSLATISRERSELISPRSRGGETIDSIQV